MRSFLGLFFIAALAAWLITPAVAALGRRLGAYGQARERGDVILVPRLGGLAILLAVLASACVLTLTPNGLRALLGVDWRLGVKLLIPGVMVLGIGFYDDLRGATPAQKLTVQTLAAGAAWWLGFRLTAMPVLGLSLHSSLLGFLLTVLWIVAVTNGVNLLDGLDALAAGVAFLVTLSLFIVALMQGDRLPSVLAVILAGALLGFLRFNSPPARIFLGDTGSLFLGCVLATLALAVAGKGATLVGRTVPYVALGLPLLDVALSVARRMIKGNSIFAADCDHIHHRLVTRQQGYRPAILTLYGVAAASSLGSLLILRWTASLALLGMFLGALTAWLVFGQLRYEEFDELALYASRLIRSAHRPHASPMVIRHADSQRPPGGSK